MGQSSDESILNLIYYQMQLIESRSYLTLVVRPGSFQLVKYLAPEVWRAVHIQGLTADCAAPPKMLALNEKRQHNLRLPVSRLPHEILSTIFFNFRDISRSQTEQGLKCLLDWISVTHVCHAWREIALNTPLLWSHIDVLPSSGPLIPELLRRSKDSPITVFVPFRNAPIDEVVKHLGRVRKLVLHAPHDDVLHKIFSSSSNFRNLETLDMNRRLPDDRQFILADAHLSGIQRLRTLNLYRTSIDWNGKFLQGLTHLKLERIPGDRVLEASDFALVLSKIPALESLYLSYFLRNMGQVKDDKAVKVHLQHLRELHVENQMLAMARFLPCIIIPRSCKISILIRDVYYEISDEFRVILSWVSNQLSVPTTTPLACSDTGDHGQYIRTLHVTNHSVMNFTVEGFCSVLSRDQVETADPILRFTMFWIYHDDKFLQTFFPLLPLDGVVLIDAVIHFTVDQGPEFWRAAFGSIETLKTVYLSYPTSDFWEALAPVNHNNADVGSLPFAALASVTAKDDRLDFQLVVDTLRLRFQLGGRQLQDLHLIYDGEKPPAAIIAQLGELVPHFRFVDSEGRLMINE